MLIYKNDGIITRIFAFGLNPIIALERADQVAPGKWKNRYKICSIKRLRLRHSLLTPFNNED